MSMSKKKSRKVRAVEPPAARKRRPRLTKATAAVLAACVVAALATATRFEPLRRAAGLAPASAPPTPTPQGDLALSKEYIYAGGRLVATEEPTPTPTPTPSGPPPADLLATASFPTPTTTVVNLTWSAPAGTVASYVVERGLHKDGPYEPAGPPATTLPTAANPYVDHGAAPATVYVYRVKALFTNGGSSGYSNLDLATTVRYSGDDPLVPAGDPQGRPASAVRAANLTELRGVVEDVRTLAGVGDATWESNPAPQWRGLIRAAHFKELRDNLNPALAALGMGQLPDESSITAGQPIRADHIQHVREKVR
jgi:hypothetical protein